MNHITFGLMAEYFALIIYKLKFYKILGHRVRNYLGEIDIIVANKKQIIFIEVKARRNIKYDKLLSYSQSARIKKAALLYLTSQPHLQELQIRFDLVVVIPYKFPIIIRNAW